MLKAPIILPNGETIYPQKGTPQGGILSPLLSNIVLNELDWWIVSQWEKQPAHNVRDHITKTGAIHRGRAYDAFRKSGLKEMHMVRCGTVRKMCNYRENTGITRNSLSPQKACQSRWKRQIRKLDYFTQGYTPIATRNKRRNNQGLPLTTTAHLQTKGKAKQATPTGKYASHLILKRVSLLLENCKFTLVNTES